MKSIGKTYLIKIEEQKEEQIGGIYIPQTASYESVYFTGIIADYGIGFTEEEKVELLPIGTKVLLDYRKEVSQNHIPFLKNYFLKNYCQFTEVNVFT